jgi:trehalose 6-phosphate synthase
MSVIVVSNRVAQPSADGPMVGGLAAALLPAVRRSGAIWLGASGKTLAQDQAEPMVKVQSLGAGALATVDLPDESYRLFYEGMANSVVWPLLHFRADLMEFDSSYFAAYRQINAMIAHAVLRFLRPDSLVWVHDYHFLMLADALRRRGVRQPLGFFLHTPFPTASLVVCMPRHKEIFRALLAYDLLGFQTEEDVTAFRDYAATVLDVTVLDRHAISWAGRTIRIQAFPIGIEPDGFAAAAAISTRAPEVAVLRRNLEGGRVVIGVDRLDYSKGLSNRFRAYDRYLEHYGDPKAERCTFLQIGLPTREDIQAYRHIRNDLAKLAGEINGRHSRLDWTAIRYINEGFAPDVLAGFYRLADVGCVTPFRDGMNLVAKEYVAAQDPEDPGVLVLSQFAGAARELDAALQVNPYDVDEMARTLDRALTMSLAERVDRHAAMMAVLRKGNLTRWFESFVDELGGQHGSAELPRVGSSPMAAA